MSIKQTKDGTIITIYVKPNASKFSVKLDCDEIVVHCTQKPVKGRVNREIIKEFTKLFHAQVEIAFGLTSKEKKLLIKDVETKEVERLLQNSQNSPL
jgi:hypothetical protein